MNLFSASLTSEVLFVQSISVVLHSKWLTREVLNVRFWSIFVCLYSLFSYTSPSANTYLITGVQYFFTGAQMIYRLGWRSGFVSFQFSLKAHKPPQVFGLGEGGGGAQRPDLSRLIEAPWCLLCSVSPHCAVAILYPDIFYMSHTNSTTIML